jgi:cytochrome c oxidase assembly protein Cox11
MIKKKTLTPIILAGIFFTMLSLSFAAVPLYDLFCRVTGFGGTTQVSKIAPEVILDKALDTVLYGCSIEPSLLSFPVIETYFVCE